MLNSVKTGGSLDPPVSAGQRAAGLPAARSPVGTMSSARRPSIIRLFEAEPRTSATADPLPSCYPFSDHISSRRRQQQMAYVVEKAGLHYAVIYEA